MQLSQQQFDRASQAGFQPAEHRLTGFAEACFDNNGLDELIECRTASADAADMAAWNLTVADWRAAQIQAIEFAMFNFSMVGE